MTLQFKRTCRLEVGRPGGAGLRIEHLRIAFEIEKSLKPSANTARITINNLAEHSRAAIQHHYQRVDLYAGYADDGLLPLAFSGDLDHVQHRSLPPEWISELRTGDGSKALRETRLSLSLEPGCSVGQLCRIIADRMQLPIPDKSPLDSSSETFAQGFAFTGPAEQAMRRAAAAAGLEWSIQNGVIQFLPRNGTRNVKGFELGPHSGLIDAPERLFKANERLAGAAPKLQWAARCLLNARIEPGVPVELDSRTVQGTFRVDALRHVGDTHGNDWYTELELGVYGEETVARDILAAGLTL